MRRLRFGGQDSGCCTGRPSSWTALGNGAAVLTLAGLPSAHPAPHNPSRDKWKGKGKKKAKVKAKMDYYALLGLQNERWAATPDQIRLAYRKSALLHHPDKQVRRGGRGERATTLHAVPPPVAAGPSLPGA